MNRKLLGRVGLKWDPFVTEIPIEALYQSPAIEAFVWRTENALVREGGFGRIRGASGTGKSTALRLLEDRLRRVADVTVAKLERPTSGVADLYREMGDLFGLALKPHNRWAGFKALRERWQAHIESTTTRPVLLIDEAQDLLPMVLNELRFLSSTCLDSRIILTVVLCADERLDKKLEHPDLIPLASRIRARLTMERATPDELMAHLKHLLTSAGNAKLMTPELMRTVCEHSMGNLRAMTSMASELLALAVQMERDQLDEKLFLELDQTARPARAPGKRPRVVGADA
jgi:type II secretory pathway predicted ATPase ExeA